MGKPGNEAKTIPDSSHYFHDSSDENWQEPGRLEACIFSDTNCIHCHCDPYLHNLVKFTCIDGFHGVWLSLLGGKSWGLCLVQLYAKYRQGSYIESLLLVLKDKRSCFSQSEGSIVQLLLSAHLSSRSRRLN